jgi:hypothetical protein
MIRGRAWLLVLAVSRLAAAGAPGWTWDDTPDVFPKVAATAGQGDAHYRLDHFTAGDHVVLRLVTDPWVAVLERVDYPDLHGVAIAVDADRIYVASYNRIATGCKLTAYTTKDATQLWSVTLEGVGPVMHSKYGNRVQLRVVDGQPVVFGWESAGRYVEVRDAATGKLAAHDKLPGQVRQPQLAEALYLETAGMLDRQARYTVGAHDFLARHVYMKGADHAAIGKAFDQAVRALQGFELSRHQQLALELRDTGTDFVVTATRK